MAGAITDPTTTVPWRQPNGLHPQPTPAGAISDYNNLTAQYQLGQAANAPATVAAQNTINQGPNLINQINANYANQQRVANQEAGYQQQNLGLQQNQLGIQQGALNRQSALLPQQYGLQTAGYDIAQGGLERQQALQPQQQALQEQSYGQAAKDIAAGYQRQQQATQSAGVTSGNLFSHGFADTVGYQAEQHASQVGGLQRAKQSEELGYKEQVAQLQDQFKSLGLQRKGAGLTFADQMAQLQDQKKNLDIVSSSLGISGQEIASRLQNSLQQLGLDQMMSVDQVIQTMVDARNGKITPQASVLGSIMQNSGISLPSQAAK